MVKLLSKAGYIRFLFIQKPVCLIFLMFFSVESERRGSEIQFKTIAHILLLR